MDVKIVHPFLWGNAGRLSSAPIINWPVTSAGVVANALKAVTAVNKKNNLIFYGWSENST